MDLMSPEEMATAQARLGVPDVTGGKMLLPPVTIGGLDEQGPPAPLPPASIDLSGPQPQIAPYVPKPLLGQPALVDPRDVASTEPKPGEVPNPLADDGGGMAAPAPVTVTQSDTKKIVHGGVKSDPALDAARAKLEDDQQKTIYDQAQLKAQEEAKIATVQAQQQAAAEAARAAAEKSRAEQERKEQEQRDRIAEAEKEHAALGAYSEGAGTRVANAIALALGGFGRALGGQSNVEQVIEASRAQKLNEWKSDYERRKGKVTGAQNLYALLRQKGLDDTAATQTSLQNLNDQYIGMINQVKAQSKAPQTLAAADQAAQSLKAQSLAAAETRNKEQQDRVVSETDTKKRTGVPGASTKQQQEVIEGAAKNDDIKGYRTKRDGAARFRNFVSSGADGTAIVDFIAGKGGLDQGSFGPSISGMLKKRGWVGDGIEKLRSTWSGGAPPDVVRELQTALDRDAGAALVRAKPAIQHYARAAKASGVDPQIILGGDTEDDTAASAGFKAAK